MKKNKSAAVGMVICFVAVIALAGSLIFKQYQKNKGQELAQNEQTDVTEEPEDNKQEENLAANSQSVENTETEKPEEEAKEEPEKTTQTASQPDALSFSAENLILWPVDGNVLLNYSMDQTVYFATLDQYKYNPALIISGEVGDEVMAAERGIVSSIEVDAQTGTTVTVEMGNGYEAVYGQLKEVPVTEGTYVKQGAILGYLSEPTKYYSVEGCNLYFQILKDGEPVNPLEFLDV